MKSHGKLRWVAAAALWVVTIVLLQGAHGRIDEIRQCRAASERLRGDARFRRLEAERLARVAQLRDGLVSTVNSVALGLIGLRRDLEDLASRAGVRLELLDAEPAQSSDNQIACHVVARGSVKGLLKLLAEIDQRPFLQPRGMELKVSAGAAEGILDERFSFHYRIRSPVASEDGVHAAAPATVGAKAP
jgi:hypothetical protein